MYQITDKDKTVLFRVGVLDSVRKLTMLKKETIALLEAANITIIDDLEMRADDISCIADKISVDEMLKLRAVCSFLFRGAA